jgi:dTDP-4-amino-4,6-dideoxygalactose transaminase
MKVNYLDLPRQFKDPGLLAVIRRELALTHFVGGESVGRFEAAFARLCQTRRAIGLNSGTDALFLGLVALGIGEGDEVITAPNSFIATAGAIVAAGASPVFADVGADYNLDPHKVEAAITQRTRAVIPVHLTGKPADMPAILRIARRRKLFVLEDAAQAVGAEIRGRRVGSFGDLGCFSLHPLKNLNVAGDGGAATTSSSVLAERLIRLRNHGLRNRVDIDCFGYNSRLDSLHAAIALYGLKRLNAVTRRRIANARLYDELLSPLADRVVVPPRPAGIRQVFHTYVVQAEDRERLIDFLARRGIETKIHYPVPIHLQRPCRKYGYGLGDFPVCEAQAKRILTLPIHQFLTESQIHWTASEIRTFYEKRRR